MPDNLNTDFIKNKKLSYNPDFQQKGKIKVIIKLYFLMILFFMVILNVIIMTQNQLIFILIIQIVNIKPAMKHVKHVT